MEKHREQLWAEALNLYRQGYEAWLPQQMKKAQRTATEVHRNRDDLIEDAVSSLPTDGMLTLDQIIRTCRRDPARINKRRGTPLRGSTRE